MTAPALDERLLFEDLLHIVGWAIPSATAVTIKRISDAMTALGYTRAAQRPAAPALDEAALEEPIRLALACMGYDGTHKQARQWAERIITAFLAAQRPAAPVVAEQTTGITPDRGFAGLPYSDHAKPSPAQPSRIAALKAVAVAALPLHRLANELCDAVDLAAEDIGGARSTDDILAELGPAVDAARNALARLDGAQTEERK